MNIISMRVIHDATPSAGAGNIALATFNLSLGPIVINGCRLVRRPARGDVVVYTPEARSGGSKSGVWIRDGDVRQEVQEQALAAYGAMTGNVEDAA